MSVVKPASSFAQCSGSRILVIGYGSIGRRHARLFTKIGAEVTVVSRRAAALSADGIVFCSSLTAIQDPHFDYAVIASETSAHLRDLQALRACDWAQDIPVLVEKPLLASEAQLTALAGVTGKSIVYLGFNLRFLPVVQEARRQLAPDQPLIRAEFHSHSYLPHWRPDQDYRATSSARRVSGGGVLRDLSHELDLLYWFAGQPTDLEAFGGHLSALELDVEDNVVIVGASARCRLFSVSLSYTQHFETRSLKLISEDKTVVADLMSGELTVATSNGVQKSLHPCQDFDDTYRDMHAAILRGGDVRPTSFEGGCANVELIERLTSKVWAAS